MFVYCCLVIFTYHQPTNEQEMSYYKNSSSFTNKVLYKQLQTPEQIQQASIQELRSDPLLWAAYRRAFDDNISDVYWMNHNSSRSNSSSSFEENNGSSLVRQNII